MILDGIFISNKNSNINTTKISSFYRGSQKFSREKDKLPAKNKKASFSSTTAIAIKIDEADLCLKEVMLKEENKNLKTTAKIRKGGRSRFLILYSGIESF